MPFIVISGLPCSGKSTMALKLKNYFENNKNIKTKIISESNFYKSGKDRNSIYSDSHKEKNLRASMKSEVERDLSNDQLLILDGLNYVKGFRYELFCVSKCNRTTQCTIHCDVSIEDSRVLNKRRMDGSGYHETVLKGLFMRYETPEGRNRWDSPLFYMPLRLKTQCDNIDIIGGSNNKSDADKDDNVDDVSNKEYGLVDNEDIKTSGIDTDIDMTSDAARSEEDNATMIKPIVNDASTKIVNSANLLNDFKSSDDELTEANHENNNNNNNTKNKKGPVMNTKWICGGDNEEVFDEIHDCLMLKKCPKPHLSTITAPKLPANFLHELDNITKDVVKEIIQKQQNSLPGDKILITSSNHQVNFTRLFCMAELQRVRRQYVAYSRTHPISDSSLIASSFVQYVNSLAEL